MYKNVSNSYEEWKEEEEQVPEARVKTNNSTSAKACLVFILN